MTTNRPTLDAPHAVAADEVVSALGTDAHGGLSTAAVAERLADHGKNELTHAPPESWWRRLARQFADLLIGLLIAAALISGLLGEWLDACAILAIVILNGVFGFVQEGRAEQALAALRKLASPKAKVIRDGRSRVIAAADLVPGDRIDLEPGDRVPADVRLIASAVLRVEEAALTGESIPADKDHRTVLDAGTPLGDRVNMAYMGTAIATGTASAVVVATGMETEIGRIAGMLEHQGPEQTPLQRKLTDLGQTLLLVVLGIVGFLFIVELLRGGKLAHAFLLSVSLAVAAVPEGLAAVVTVVLAIGIQRMARRNALIRRLSERRDARSGDGDLLGQDRHATRNEMTVVEIMAGGSRYELTGTGYAPEGEFSKDAKVVDPLQEPALLEALRVAAWCGSAQVTRAGDTGTWEVIGDPTEGALVVAASKGGVRATDRRMRIVHEIPFHSDRKVMSVVVRGDDGRRFMYTKGAPAVVVEKCTREHLGSALVPLSQERRQAILAASREMGGRALRVLSLAYREVGGEHDHGEADLVFAGLAGMIDPPRDEARTAVRQCVTAGIRPVMITGDHPSTAMAIARDLEMVRADDQVVIGKDLDAMSDADLAARVDRIPVYARVTAAHKLRIVKAWRERGQVIAMTGDGVNDAPAIQAADVGIGMGVTGTDVTKEASDLVLTDDNFASIVNAVEEGRTIYDNIRKFVHYLLATNAGEVLLVLFATLAGWPFPLFPIQIIWINLVTDALPALGLGVEPPEPDVMQRPPRPPTESLISRARGLRILFYGALNAIAAAIAFAVVHGGSEENLPAARTAAFGTLAFSQLLFSLGCRSERYTLIQIGLFSNPWLVGGIAVSALAQVTVMTVPVIQPFFKVAPVANGWLWVLFGGLALAPVTVIEAAKWIRLHRTSLAARPDLGCPPRT